jgi:Arc/MetJ-type ribon-helix-helix transcriptional regulator
VKTISLKLPETLHRRIADLARRRGRSKSEVIRDAIEAILDNARPAKGPSALELAGELCGCLRGPGDLSYNRKHLEDFGK